MDEKEITHPLYGPGTVISVRIDEAGRRVATCRFDEPPGMLKESRGVKPVAEVVLDEDEQHGG
jgi:hypothetical protein